MSRRGAVGIHLLLLILLLGSLAGFTWADNAVNRGVTYTPSNRPIPWAGGPSLGVNAYNIQFEPDPANVTRTLEMARDLGAGYVRLQLPWEDVEIAAKGDFVDHRHQPERSAWEKYDFIMDETRRLGLEPVVRIDRPPAWARTASITTPKFQAGLQENGDSTGPPDNYADYADFVGAVATRYRGKVRFIQIWNEPNLSYEWNWVLPEPERFTELLRLAATAARAANPDIVILFPSLSPTDGLEPRKAPMSELEYLDRVYAAGGAPFFDIMSAQAYGLGQPPDEHRYIFLRGRSNWNWGRPIDTRIDVSRVVLLREVMERHDDAGKAVWISEFGYNSAPESIPEPARSNWGRPVSEELKGEYLIGQMERARKEWPWIGVMNLWFLRWGGYREADPADPTPYFALVDRDFQPLPAYLRLKSYLADGPVAGVGTHAWEHPAVVSQGERVWQIHFSGTSLALRGGSPAEISINGGAPLNVRPGVEGQFVTVASGLADTTHTALVRVESTHPTVFRVERQQPWPLLWVLAPLVLLAALIGVGTSFIRNIMR